MKYPRSFEQLFKMVAILFEDTRIVKDSTTTYARALQFAEGNQRFEIEVTSDPDPTKNGKYNYDGNKGVLYSSTSNVNGDSIYARLGVGTSSFLADNGFATIPAILVAKGKTADKNQYNIIGVNSNNKVVVSFDNTGRLDLNDYAGEGAVIALRNYAPSAVNSVAGHYAMVALNSNNQPSTIAYILSQVLSNTPGSISSRLSLGYMDAVNDLPSGTYAYQQPNKIVQISSAGLILPDIPIKATGGVINIQDKAYIGGNGVGIGANVVPTHPLTLGLGSNAGQVFYAPIAGGDNGVINWARLLINAGVSVYNIQSTAGGTGTALPIRIDVNNTVFQINNNALISGVTALFAFARSGGQAAIIGVSGDSTSGNTVQSAFQDLRTINQSGTAGYRGLWVSVYEQALGSGIKNPIDIGTNSAAAGAGTHTSKFAVDNNGKITFQTTNTATGTTGAQTINKPNGKVNFAAGEISLVVTNSLVTTASDIHVQVKGNDATAKSATVIEANGSFTITLNAAATAETKVSFVVFN